MKRLMAAASLSLVCLIPPSLAAADPIIQVKIISGGSNTVTAIQFARPGDRYWGQDALQWFILPGDSHYFHLDAYPTCYWNVRFTYSDGFIDELDNWNICNSQTAHTGH
jgi:hypothetical protein